MISKARLDAIEGMAYLLILITLCVVMVGEAIRHYTHRLPRVVVYPKPSPEHPVVPFTSDDAPPLGPLDTPGAVSSQQREIENGGDQP